MKEILFVRDKQLLTSKKPKIFQWLQGFAKTISKPTCAHRLLSCSSSPSHLFSCNSMTKMSKNNGLGKNNVGVVNVKQLNITMLELSLFSFEELEVPIYRPNFN